MSREAESARAPSRYPSRVTSDRSRPDGAPLDAEGEDRDEDDALPTRVDVRALGGPPAPPGAAAAPARDAAAAPASAVVPSDPARTVVEGPARQRSVSEVRVTTRRDPGPSDFESRYEVGELLGEGGMGEVRLSVDTRIGRTVAVKAIRPENAERARLRARFLFEAKVQGQLEHPSIVPVYDLGQRADGSEFFTMKRLRGRTLHEVLKALRLGDRAIAGTFTRRRLIAAFQSVCLAVEFAHQRGVIHRDLKPSNVMLGEFGEVYVIDWGLAKLSLRDPAITPSPEGAAALEEPRSLVATEVGEVLGTPGYMSPEQAIDSQRVGPATDIFSLGAMLFEILTLRQLIPGQSHADVKVATIAGKYEARFSKRFPELDAPVELEEICVKATEVEPEQRYAHARAIADAVERYLEGDRSVEHRKHLAGQHTREAIRALAESASAGGPEEAKAARSKAIREVNHALAIDPQNQTALRTLMRIVTEMPSAIAPEAEAAIRESEGRALTKAARRGSLAYLSLTGNVAIMALLGVENLTWLGVACAFFLGAAVVVYLGSRSEQPSASRFALAAIALSSCGIAATSMLFGPLVYVPSLCGANVVVFAAGLARRYRWAAMAGGVLALLLPLLLERLGWIDPGWVFRGDHIAILPRAVRFPETPTLLLLGIASLGTVLFPALLVGAERDARAKAERELLLRTHHLAELVPPEAKGSAALPRRAPRA